jgi:hypothetical protein
MRDRLVAWERRAIWACLGSSASTAPPLPGHSGVVGHGVDVLGPSYEADPITSWNALAVRIGPRELDEFLGASSAGRPTHPDQAGGGAWRQGAACQGCTAGLGA